MGFVNRYKKGLEIFNIHELQVFLIGMGVGMFIFTETVLHFLTGLGLTVIFMVKLAKDQRKKVNNK